MTNKYSERLIEEIVERNDIVDIVSEYVNLKKTGKNYKGLCPFHNEKTPSFIVSEDKQLYHCFGCGSAGNVIHFIMNIENLDFLDSIEVLAEKSNIDITQYKENDLNKEEFNKKKKLYEINREAALYFYKQLLTTKNEGLKYFKNRGIDINIIKKFGLGYAINEWESLNKYLLKKGFSQDDIFETGLVIKRKDSKGYYDRFRNRVIFPIINPTKKVIGFGGRVLDDAIPKYLNSPESKIFNKRNTLYGLNLARSELGKDKKLIVVEGYTDVISFYQFGIKNVVATLGTAFTKNHGQLLKRYCDEVIIAFDSDTAGQAATLRGLDILEEVGCKVKVLNFDEDMDPDEFIRKYGPDSVRLKISKSMQLIDYKLEILKNNYNIETDEGKINFVKEAVKVIKPLKSHVERDIYIKKVSKIVGIPTNVIKSEVYGNNDKKYSKNYSKKPNSFYNKTTNVSPVKIKEKNGSYEIEKRIISMCLINKTNYKKIKNKISSNDFTNENSRDIFLFLEKYYEDHEVINLEHIYENLDIDQGKLINEISNYKSSYDDFDKALEDVIISLKRIKIDREIYFIKKEIKKLEMKENKEEGDVNRLKELCIRLMELGEKLKNIRIN